MKKGQKTIAILAIGIGLSFLVISCIFLFNPPMRTLKGPIKDIDSGYAFLNEQKKINHINVNFPSLQALYITGQYNDGLRLWLILDCNNSSMCKRLEAADILACTGETAQPADKITFLDNDQLLVIWNSSPPSGSIHLSVKLEGTCYDSNTFSLDNHEVKEIIPDRDFEELTIDHFFLTKTTLKIEGQLIGQLDIHSLQIEHGKGFTQTALVASIDNKAPGITQISATFNIDGYNSSNHFQLILNGKDGNVSTIIPFEIEYTGERP